MNDYNRLVNQYNAIVEQNKQLQAELATAKINYQELHDECAADYADYKGLKEECEKYKNCIDDIKDELETSSHCESEECGCDDYRECLECTIKLILKKINEVENE